MSNLKMLIKDTEHALSNAMKLNQTFFKVLKQTQELLEKTDSEIDDLNLINRKLQP